MRITQTFGSYNSRRYGRPWIGKITSWPIGKQSEISWGSYLGNDNGGEVEIEANPGDIIRTGQKDNRGGNTSGDWYIVSLDKSLIPTNAANAKKHWETMKIEKENIPSVDLSTISNDDLVKEIKRRGLLQTLRSLEF
ncbi:MAG: hypothetical protein ABIC57_01420 [bacterium]